MQIEVRPDLSQLEPFSIAGLLVLSALFVFLALPKKSQLPMVNEKGAWEFRSARVKSKFVQNGRKLLKAGLSKARMFHVNSDNGLKIILGSEYANEIRSHHALSFGAAIQREFHADLHGFEPFKQGTTSEQIFQDAVRMKLTQSLGSVMQPLSEETSVALDKQWTDNTDWHDINLKSSVLKIVAQLSSKVFLGDKICRNPDWLRITVDYTVDSFLAAQDLRRWPAIIRPIVAPFLSSCQKVRQELEEATAIISKVLGERRKDKEAALKANEPPKRYNDAMEWMEDCAKGRSYDAAVAQISFSLFAIHTTSDLLTQTLLDLSTRQQLIQELRDEIVTVIREEGWKKSTLFKMKLMDSVLKESQRLKPIGIATMRRVAGENIKLSDGNLIPKGMSLLVSNEAMWDSSVYPDAMTYDPYRFLRLREVPGHETSAQLVSPSPEHMGFGYGKHVCPGRFFAANEVKIALCHILLKYDIKLVEGCEPTVRMNGFSMNADNLAKVSIKRRKEEISL